jgi:hypothetical protein
VLMKCTFLSDLFKIYDLKKLERVCLPKRGLKQHNTRLTYEIRI